MKIPTNPYVIPGIKRNTKDIQLDSILNAIITEVNNTEITTQHIVGRLRHRRYSDLRHVYCYVSRKLTLNSLEVIGSKINRDHATVIHGCRMAENIPELTDISQKVISRLNQTIENARN